MQTGVIMPAANNDNGSGFARVLLTELEDIAIRREEPNWALLDGLAQRAVPPGTQTPALDQYEREILDRAQRGARGIVLLKVEKERQQLLQRAREEDRGLTPEENEQLEQQRAQAEEEAEQWARKHASEKRRLEEEKRRREAKERQREKEERQKTLRETEELEAQREPGDEPSTKDRRRNELLKKAREHAREMDLTGLALSGGGIRSATFCLGILQGLADLGLLKRFDYLSTVSGGGYMGGWLAAWIKREGSIRAVEKQLRSTRVNQVEGRQPSEPGPTATPVEEEPEPIFHLRSYSNYLAPRPGLSSADSWVLLATYLRNFLLNQLILLPTILAALLLVRLGVLFYNWNGSPNQRAAYLTLGALTLVGVIWSSVFILDAVSRLRRASAGRARGDQTDIIQVGVWRLKVFILPPLVLASLLVGWFVWDDLADDVSSRNQLRDGVALFGWLVDWVDGLVDRDSPYLRSALLYGIGAALIFFVLHLIFVLIVYVWPRRRNITSEAHSGSVLPQAHPVWWVVSGVLSGFVAGALLGVLMQLAYQQMPQEWEASIAEHAFWSALMLTLAPPIGLLVFVFGAVIQVGLMGSSLDEAEREWWASLCGWVMRWALAWAVFFTLALFSVPFLIWAGPVLQSLLGTGWVLTTLGGVFAGRSPRTGSGPSNRLLEPLARVAPYLFVVGLLVALSWLLSAWVDCAPAREMGEYFVDVKQTPANPPTHVVEATVQEDSTRRAVTTSTREFTNELDTADVQRWCYWGGFFNSSGNSLDWEDFMAKDEAFLVRKLTGWFAGCLAVALFASWCVGVNTFSLHGLYGNRLIRCYLGASRPKDETQTDQLHGVPANTGPPKRHPNPITGFDPLDDLPLAKLRIKPAEDPRTFQTGLPQERPYRGPFLLVNTALNLVQGDELAWEERKAEAFLLSAAYCGSKSTDYRNSEEYGNGISLGTAVTLSGAAASPNMGYHSSPAVTALLTVFNVRLGGWLGNPNQTKWKNAEPQMALLLLLNELFGRTNRRSNYIYLSDGGHFDNLGVYELVRRHCRYIVVCDAGQDAGYAFYDLGSLIRKCRSDLGVPIEIDVTPIKPQGTEGHSKWHCVIGKIRYDALDPEAIPGLLVYIKSSLTGDEPSDVLNYAVEHPPFPHQTTANQFFTESQFESYRALGHHIASEVFGDAMRGVEATEEMSDAAHRRVIRRLFSNLHRCWFPPPPKLEESFLQSVQGYTTLDAELRTGANLGEFSLSLYPELAGQPAATLDHRRAELHTVSEMLQLMENAWLGVHLEGFHAHPMNRGWMNVFRRWASSERFRQYWLTLRGEFSQDFVRFCENELKLDRGWPRTYLLAAVAQAPALSEVLLEFQREWPRERPLDQLLQKAVAMEPNGATQAAWLIAVVPRTDPEPDQWTLDRYPCGIVLVWEPPDTTEDYELLVWLRGSYRNLGIGREALDELLPEVVSGLQQLPQRRKYLRVRYPQAGEYGGVDRMQTAMWSSFFYQYRFRPIWQNQDAGPVEDLILRRSF
jgi:hypothetical protein